jgi:23S rRNA (guanosine2251-2'-O)-methyltransferase
MRTRRMRSAPSGPVLLYGWHTVKAALENPKRRIRNLLLTRNAARRLEAEGVVLPVQPTIAEPDTIRSHLSADAVHQGLLAEADPLPAPQVEELASLRTVLVLDQITDPHNVGAILRSAAAFGVGAVMTTSRHSPDATGVLAKAASGALEFVPIVCVQNLARALEAQKAQGFLVVGLDSESPSALADQPLRTPLALVLGAEGKGLRQLTRSTCHQLARLALPGPIQSLNVSNAAALALYIVSTQIGPAP